ncbi:MAG TPA: EAL domain-containing protein [Candidatus Limnocylindria bacterium]|nr:EAL domain-containing protein [Candidatus Limnocylindria bacterium]
MLLSRGGLARPTLERRASSHAALAIAALAASAVLVTLGPISSQLVRVAAALAAVGFAHAGWRAGIGRERRIRTWIFVALTVWLVSEVMRLVGAIAGWPAHLADVGLIGLGVAAVGLFLSTAHGRMRPAEETALYLDAGAVLIGVLSAAAIVGGRFVTDASGAGILLHAGFLVAIFLSSILLLLAVHVPLRWVGPWEGLLGLSLGAAGYIGLLVPGMAFAAVGACNLLVAAGTVVVGRGGGRWTTAEDNSPRYMAITGSVRAILPIANALLTGAVAVMLVTRPDLVSDPLRIVVATGAGLVVVAAVARQTIILVDRETVLRRERLLTDELTVAEAQYRSVVDRVPGVVYVADVGQHGRWHFVSAKIEELLGYSAEEWTADPTMWMSRMHPADRERMMLAETQDHERSEPVGRWEYRLIARDGRIVWVIDDEAIVARDPDGRPTMVQGILVDISERKDLEDQLRHQALHDPLTGLPNRVLFVDRLSHALVRRGRADAGIAVLFVDLDDFKAVNDTLGHAVGDELLARVGRRLSTVVRAEDTACRLGGDEFAFILEDATPTEATEVARRIAAALGEPFDVGGRSASLTASIGIASRARLGEDGNAAEAADELLHDADTAMYAAKSLGKGRIRIFDRRLEEPVARRRQLRSALEQALDGDELFLEYQPMVDLRTGLGFGLEALVRWNHPQLGRLMPADFVPLAEETGLIGALGEWVLEHACADLATGDMLASVNVSAHQLGHGELPERVEAALRRTGLPPDRLLLELTESTLASAGAGAESELQGLQALGVRIALDDFGSGYSSLEYLGRLPVDILKIDRSLVERAHLEPQRQEVLKAILHIADRLGLETIVEGVEREAQRATLLDLGFRQAQGFLFAAAAPLGDALALSAIRRAS